MYASINIYIYIDSLFFLPLLPIFLHCDVYCDMTLHSVLYRLFFCFFFLFFCIHSQIYSHIYTYVQKKIQYLSINKKRNRILMVSIYEYSILKINDDQISFDKFQKKIHFDIEYKMGSYSMLLLNNHSILNLIFE